MFYIHRVTNVRIIRLRKNIIIINTSISIGFTFANPIFPMAKMWLQSFEEFDDLFTTNAQSKSNFMSSIYSIKFIIITVHWYENVEKWRQQQKPANGIHSFLFRLNKLLQKLCFMCKIRNNRFFFSCQVFMFVSNRKKC